MVAPQPLPYATAPSWGPGYAAAPPNREEDAAALRWIEIASVVGLISAIASIVLLLGFGGALVTVSGGGTSTQIAPATSWAPFLAVSAAIAVAYLYLYRRAFELFARRGEEQFKIPRLFVLFAMIAVVLLFTGAGLLLEAVREAIQCAGTSSPIPASCFNGGYLGGGVAALIVGVILGILGVIGLLLGIWRIGTRFDRDLFKAAAILLIIPYVSVVGYVLLLWAAHSTRERTLAAGTIPGFV